MFRGAARMTRSRRMFLQVARSLLLGIALAPAFLFAADTPFTRPAARPIADILANASRKDTVVVKGKVKRPFNFDTFLLTDGTGEIAVSLVGLQQNVGPGDSIIVAGRYQGKFSYVSRYGLVEATAWAKAVDPRAAELLRAYGVTASPAPSPSASSSPTSPVATPVPDVETRLKKLENLKNRNLISPEEYREQRRRILNDL